MLDSKSSAGALFHGHLGRRMRGSRDLRISTLENGLLLAVVESHEAPIVTTVLWVSNGASVDGAGQAGTAHFLEHMMFKGSARFGPGEIDHLTQVLGGSNNAFTSHDSTAYHFELASDRWQKALAMESDRMAGLRFEAREVESERQVILEEISMYESEPWDVLETEVRKSLFGDHPYGRPVLGSREELRAITAENLAEFHERFYCPRNSVLIVAGDVGSEVESVVAEAFAPLPSGEQAAAVSFPVAYPDELLRVELLRGEVPRLRLALPGVAVTDEDHAGLRLLLHLLTVGRSSFLHRVLVEDERLCSWVSTDLSEFLDPGSIGLALELLPGVEPELVERRVFELLDEVRERSVSPTELSRAKRLYEADWVFAHERVCQRALFAASALAHHDGEFPERYRESVLACSASKLQALSRRYLDVGQGVVGWSLPA